MSHGREYNGIKYVSDDHKIIWDQLERTKLYPKGIDYKFLPRGRVQFDSNKREYQVIAGSWFNEEAKSVVINDFYLPNCVFDKGPHYEEFKDWVFGDDRDKDAVLDMVNEQ